MFSKGHYWVTWQNWYVDGRSDTSINVRFSEVDHYTMVISGMTLFLGNTH